MHSTPQIPHGNRARRLLAVFASCVGHSTTRGRARFVERGLCNTGGVSHARIYYGAIYEACVAPVGGKRPIRPEAA
eukprot:1195881-Prorocentrum_minimum.AAC.5